MNTEGLDLLNFGLSSITICLFSVPGILFQKVQSRYNYTFNFKLGLIPTFISGILISFLISISLLHIENLLQIIFIGDDLWKHFYYLFDFEWFNKFLEYIDSPKDNSDYKLFLISIVTKLLPVSLFFTVLLSGVFALLKKLTNRNLLNHGFRLTYFSFSFYYYVLKIGRSVERQLAKGSKKQYLGKIINFSKPLLNLIEAIAKLILAVLALGFIISIIVFVFVLVLGALFQIHKIISFFFNILFHLFSALRSPVDKMFFQDFDSLFGTTVVEISYKDNRLAKGLLNTFEVTKEGRLDFVTISNVVLYKTKNDKFFNRGTREVYRFSNESSLFTTSSENITNINTWIVQPQKISLHKEIGNPNSLIDFFWFYEISEKFLPFQSELTVINASKIHTDLAKEFFEKLLSYLKDYSYPWYVTYRRRTLKQVWNLINTHFKFNSSFYMLHLDQKRAIKKDYYNALKKYGK